MVSPQSEVASNVVSFVPKPMSDTSLTPRDLMDVARWRSHAGRLGYDRIVVHEHEQGDGADIANFVMLHRSGEAWSRWGFARDGLIVRAWCCLTGADIGEFASVSDAFVAILADRGEAIYAPQGPESDSVVTDLLPFLAANARSARRVERA
jgi:hypothetical protein